MADRIAVLEDRLAKVERDVAALRSALQTGRRVPYISSNPDNPLEGHPLLSKKPPRDQWAELESKRLKELGLEGIKPVGAVKLRQMLIESGIDPNGNECSRGIIEMREE